MDDTCRDVVDDDDADFGDKLPVLKLPSLLIFLGRLMGAVEVKDDASFVPPMKRPRAMHRSDLEGWCRRCRC